MLLLVHGNHAAEQQVAATEDPGSDGTEAVGRGPAPWIAPCPGRLEATIEHLVHLQAAAAAGRIRRRGEPASL